MLILMSQVISHYDERKKIHAFDSDIWFTAAYRIFRFYVILLLPARVFV